MQTTRSRRLVGNVLLGEGVPTFEPGLAQQWALRGQTRLPGSDTVAMHYDCRRYVATTAVRGA